MQHCSVSAVQSMAPVSETELQLQHAPLSDPEAAPQRGKTTAAAAAMPALGQSTDDSVQHTASSLSASSGSPNACRSLIVGEGAAAAAAVAAASSGVCARWDPVQHVRQLAGELQVADGEKLVLKEPIGKGAFGTVYKGKWGRI
jgi:hypothetical protein